MGKEQTYVLWPKFNLLIQRIPAFLPEKKKKNFVECSGFMSFVWPTGRIQTDPV